MRFSITPLIALYLILVLPCAGSSQSFSEDLIEINEQRLQLNQSGMTVLGSWAAANIIAGGVGMTQTSGRVRYFHEMNVAWNSVNLAIAGIGYFGSRNDPAAYSLSETIREFQSFQKLLLFNAGLDIGYMAFGAWLWERGIRTGSDRSIGYGRSMILQGGYLFLFDIVLYALSRNQSGPLIESLDRISPAQNGIGLRIRL
ncbi:hypothetical protein DYD21_15795 [Rhodohalobacter sp. SW132]|uniref:DUF6992 family protein n=1 Tax=Rhodohalobacter sp. SW132 TaxID=2293433 RepID=UPI000E26B47C|nr:hypothetical protein [Rhodohalobacter sp. SW132]REL24983.1 hypothetical protein DYD21_15795 [Rhodohalobacter sp. SW132]